MHTIYHIPGKKVGCTINFKSRCGNYPEGEVILVIEELHGVSDKEAGDREWFWADHFGYKRHQHYTVFNSEQARRTVEKLGPDGLKARAKKAILTQGTEGLSKRAHKTHARMTAQTKMLRAEKIACTQSLPEAKLKNSNRQSAFMQSLTTTEKSAIANKGWATRRSKLEVQS